MGRCKHFKCKQHARPLAPHKRILDLRYQLPHRPTPFPKPKTKRRHFSAEFKRVVAYAQNWRCAACECLLPPSFEIDHKRPLWWGGSNGRDNLRALCNG